MEPAISLPGTGGILHQDKSKTGSTSPSTAGG